MFVRAGKENKRFAVVCIGVWLDKKRLLPLYILGKALTPHNI